MDFVTCKCAKCDAKLGRLVNLWTQIGKKYLTPAAWTGREKLSVSSSGSIRSGDAGTLVGGCELQDAECTACRASLGQGCLRTPADHVFKDGQIIFRIGSIALKSGSDGRRRAEPKVKTVLKLRPEPPSTDGHKATPTTPEEPRSDYSASKNANNKASNIEGTDFVQLQAEMSAQRQDINRISASGYQVVSSFETAIGGVEAQVKQLRDAIDSVRKEGDGQRDDIRSLKTDLGDVKWECQNNTVVSRLDQQLQTTDRVVTELRQSIGKNHTEATELRDELSTAQSLLHDANQQHVQLKAQMDDTKDVAHEAVATSKEYASEVVSLRREVKQLRTELAKDRANPPRTDGSSFSSHELDILANNISKIGNRANQIESLQMEFDLFRSRVQRLEARASTYRNEQHGQANERGSTYDELSQSNYGEGAHKKRTSTDRGDDQAFGTTPPKRVAITSDYSSAATTGESHQSSSPLSASAARNPPPVRRTKSGAVDKRSTKRASWGARA